MPVQDLQPTVAVSLPGSETLYVSGDRSLAKISKEFISYYSSPIVAALVNNEVRDLDTIVAGPCSVSFLDIASPEGARIYQRSVTFLLLAAVNDLFPDGFVKIEHSLGRGLYCEIFKKKRLTQEDVAALEKKMKSFAAADTPFKKKKIPLEKAIETFQSKKCHDKVELLRNWGKNSLTIYSLEKTTTTLYGCMVPSAGYLSEFALDFHFPGLVLRFPDENSPSALPPLHSQPKLFEIFREAARWGKELGFDNVGSMNKLIQEGKSHDVMRIAEALHEKKIAQIADMITVKKDDILVILVAGPSSSGKTTFAQRLRTQLLVNGIRPFPISIDDYFFDRENTPRDNNGNHAFEGIEAVDLDLFNDHLLRLLSGEEIEIPFYNFYSGKREFNGHKLRLEKNQPLIIEGIHGLNEQLTCAVPRESKFKIYVSAFTALNVDHHTRIHTTDTRLLRRIVRDSQFRGIDPLATLQRWPDVRQGEEKNIFPYQEDADIMFNSTLVYEHAVLREFAVPLLENIPSYRKEYVDARRLLDLLSFFVPLEGPVVPGISILREFIGDSCFLNGNNHH